ncbi:MAG: hypothetical protein PVI86_18605 [Phycisphaerae bacterium]
MSLAVLVHPVQKVDQALNLETTSLAARIPTRYRGGQTCSLERLVTKVRRNITLLLHLNADMCYLGVCLREARRLSKKRTDST